MIWEINTQQCWNDQKKTTQFLYMYIIQGCVRKKIKMRIWYEYLRVFWKHLLEFCLIPLQYFFVWTPLKYYIARISHLKCKQTGMKNNSCKQKFREILTKFLWNNTGGINQFHEKKDLTINNVFNWEIIWTVWKVVPTT